MPQRHTIEVGIIVKDDGSIAVEKFNDNLKKTDETLKDAEKTGSKFGAGFDKFVSGAYERAGQMATNFLSQIPGQIVELGKLGAQAQAAELRFNQFAGGAERAEEFMTAFNAATMGTVDQMGAMSSAARLLQMGLVDNAEEMASVAEMATKLGDQTMGATDRISDFSLMMANQSIPRLDNFGISSGKVRARIKELQAATEDLSREEAFKIAVMEEGAKSLNTLGDTSELAQVKIDKVTAAVQDAKIGMGELIVEMISANESALTLGQGVDGLAGRIRDLPTTIQQVVTIFQAMEEATGDSGKRWKQLIANANPLSAKFRMIGDSTQDMVKGFNWLADVLGIDVDAALGKAETGFINTLAETERFKAIADDLNNRTLRVTADRFQRIADRAASVDLETERFRLTLARVTVSGSGAVNTFDSYQESLGRVKRDQQQVTEAVRNSIVEFDKEQEALLNLRNVSLDATMQFTDFFRDVAEQQEEFGKTGEELEAEHAANLEELRKRGQATLIQIDAEAEQAKLAKMQQNLELALLDQAAFTEKTKEATQKRKEIQIAELEAGITGQQQLLDDFYGGRLIRAGENVNALIETENTRHEAAIEGLEEEMQKTQELQDRQMGQLLLQTFDQWAAINEVPPKEMFNMRLALSEEYGLISAEQALMVDGAMTKWDEWLTSTDATAAGTVKAIDLEIKVIQDLAEELDRLPTQKEITIRVRTVTETRAGSSPGPGTPETFFQHGFNGMVGPGFGGARRFTAGEGASPERVIVQPVTNNEMNMTVNTRASTPSVTQDFAMMRALVA